jgi:hypothetical protein
MIVESEWSDCDYGIFMDNQAASNLFIKNEISAATTAWLWAENLAADANGMHGNTFQDTIFERDRDASAPWCGPTYGVYLSGGTAWKFIGASIGTPSNTSLWHILGSTSSELPALQEGVQSISMQNINMNLNVDGCTGSPPQQDYDTTTDCGILIDGVDDANIYSLNISNGGTRCYLKKQGHCQTTTTQACVTAADCTAESCVNVATPAVFNTQYSGAGTLSYTRGEPAMLDHVRTDGWTMRNRLSIVNEAETPGTLLDLNAIADVNTNIRLRSYNGVSADYYLRAANNGNFQVIDVLDGSLSRLTLSTSTNGLLQLNGSLPCYQLGDTILGGGAPTAKLCSNGTATENDLILYALVGGALEEVARADASTRLFDLTNGWLIPAADVIGSGGAGGQDTEVQYSDGGALNGADGLTYNDVTQETTIAEPILGFPVKTEEVDGGGNALFTLDVDAVSDPSTDDLLLLTNSQTGTDFLSLCPDGELGAGRNTPHCTEGIQLSFLASTNAVSNMYKGIYASVLHNNASVSPTGNLVGVHAEVSEVSGAAHTVSVYAVEAEVSWTTDDANHSNDTFAAVKSAVSGSVKGDWKRVSGFHHGAMSGNISPTNAPAVTTASYLRLPANAVNASTGEHWGAEFSSARTGTHAANKPAVRSGAIKLGFPREYTTGGGHLAWGDAGGDSSCVGSSDGSGTGVEPVIGGCPGPAAGPTPLEAGWSYFDDGTNNEQGLYETTADSVTNSRWTKNVNDTQCVAWIATASDPVPNATRYVSLRDSAINAAEGSVDDTRTPENLWFHTLRVEVDTAPGGGAETYVITLRDDAASTALTCTITDTATVCADTTNEVATVLGSKMNLMVVGSAAAADPAEMLVSLCTSPKAY